jgi:pilus assembly protein CpaF
MQRMPGGERKVLSISEITGMEADTITIHEVFKYEKLGAGRSSGAFVRAASQSVFFERLAAGGAATGA